MMNPSIPRTRRLLFVSPLPPYSTAGYRFSALQRLGQQVHAFDLRQYTPSSRVIKGLQFRYPFGPLVARVNHELCKRVEELRPDVVWFDKPIMFTPKTMRTIRNTGAKTIFYVQDAPFGPRNDGCWKQFKRAFRMADLHCLVRRADVVRYRAWGLPSIEVMLTFDPRMHYPPPIGFSDSNRDREISFIGHPHEQRPAFLLKLARDHRLPLYVSGNLWTQIWDEEEQKLFHLGGFLGGDQYRSGIWQSKINLSFVTEENEEDIAHKAVEIAACGGFLIALRTPGHQAIFEEDREAVFFSSVEECAEKCRFYLGRPDLREAIAARGHERAIRSGYDNDTQLARVLNRLDGKEE